MSDYTKVLMTNRFEAVEVEEYNGKLSLVLKKEGKGDKKGSFFPVWALWSTGFKQYADKPMPIKIALGDTKEDALANLKQMIRMVEDLEM